MEAKISWNFTESEPYKFRYRICLPQLKQPGPTLQNELCVEKNFI